MYNAEHCFVTLLANKKVLGTSVIDSLSPITLLATLPKEAKVPGYI
jgi:hypothetical protein